MIDFQASWILPLGKAILFTKFIKRHGDTVHNDFTVYDVLWANYWNTVVIKLFNIAKVVVTVAATGGQNGQTHNGRAEFERKCFLDDWIHETFSCTCGGEYKTECLLLTVTLTGAQARSDWASSARG